MKYTLSIAFLSCFYLFGCHSETSSLHKLKRIDMNQAFDRTKSVKLSDLVKSVEIVRFYPPKETFFVNARSFSIGKKYIMISDDRGGGRSNIILCERNGKFIRTIGRTGRGPGEFLNAWLTVMDPSENYIIIADYKSNKLIKYSVTGEFIKEHKMEELTNHHIYDEVRFINSNEFILVPRRPVKGIDDFASMLVYNSDLKPTGKILPRNNDKYLPLFNNEYQIVGEGPDRIFFWEPYFDTLYTIHADHSTEATHIIGWSKDGPSFEYMSTSTYDLPPDKQYPVNFIYSITETEKYFFIGGISHYDRFMAGYNKSSEEIFLLSDHPDCDSASSQQSPCIKNDLFGIEPIHIYEFDRQINRYVSWLRIGMIASEYDLNCIKNKKVMLPKIRDQLIEITQSPDPDNNLVLLLMEAK